MVLRARLPERLYREDGPVFNQLSDLDSQLTTETTTAVEIPRGQEKFQTPEFPYWVFRAKIK